MESEPENKSCPEEIEFALCAKTSEKEKEGEGKKKSRHDGAKADTGKVNGPVRGGYHKSRNQPSSGPMKKFFTEEIQTERS